jgi:hypothetical protein
MTRTEAARLYALRAQVDALRMQLEAWIIQYEEQEKETPRGACLHPPEYRINATTGGGPSKFLCKICGDEVVGIA